MVPSSLLISAIAATGCFPANLHKSMDASVCPGRVNTPPLKLNEWMLPGEYRSGNTWLLLTITNPGFEKWWPLEDGFARAWMVADRSAADIPVVVPNKK